MDTLAESQPQHYWQLVPDNAVLLGAVLCSKAKRSTHSFSRSIFPMKQHTAEDLVNQCRCGGHLTGKETLNKGSWQFYGLWGWREDKGRSLGV